MAGACYHRQEEGTAALEWIRAYDCLGRGCEDGMRWYRMESTRAWHIGRSYRLAMRTKVECAATHAAWQADCVQTFATHAPGKVLMAAGPLDRFVLFEWLMLLHTVALDGNFRGCFFCYDVGACGAVF